MNKIKFIDLFAGMGGLRLGLEQALHSKGIKSECVLTSEIKPHAIKVYTDNFGNDNLVGDITQIQGKDIPDFDMLLAGFPCFIGETPIYTIEGSKPICEIKIGDMVLTHTNTYKEVLEVMQRSCKGLYKLNFGHDSLYVTEEHPFYIRKINNIQNAPIWKKVKDLTNGDLLGIPKQIVDREGNSVLFGLGHYHLIDDVFWFPFKTIEKIEEEFVVYNLCVEEDNSYIANNIIVHNCQPFSSAGKQRGFDDTRGTLFFEVARILKEKQPTYFLLENVENLVIHDLSREDKKQGKTIGKTLETILYVLKDLGYNVTWKVLQASDFGAAQMRRRIFIVGSKEEFINLDDFEKKFVSFGEIQEQGKPCVDSDFSRKLFRYLKDKELPLSYLYDKAIRDKRGSSNNIHSWTLGLRGEVNHAQHELLEKMVTERRRSDLARKKGQPLKDGLGLDIEELKDIYIGNNLEEDLKILYNLGYLKKTNIDSYPNILYDIVGGRLSYEFTKILDPNKPCLTLVATDVSKLGVIDGKGIRKLTLQEGLLLNGYPNDYVFDVEYKKGFDLLGNTVVVPVVKAICERIFP